MPPEVWYEVALHLPNADLFRSIFVCRQWGGNHYPLLWRKIGRAQWRHPECPICTLEFIAAAKWEPLRRRIEDLEWENVDTLNLEGFNHERLVQLIRSLPNLKGLSLTAVELHPNSHLLNLLRDVNAMAGIKRLSLEISLIFGRNPLQVEEVFPRCQFLEELSLAGSFFNPVINAEEEEQEREQERVWELTSLKTPRHHLGLLCHCPKLLKLELTGHPSISDATSLQPILACRKLQELKFIGWMAFSLRIRHFDEVLKGLSALSLLQIGISQQEQFARLGLLTDPSVAPRLRGLVLQYASSIIVAVTGVPPLQQEAILLSNQDMLTNILRAHPCLDTFILRGIAIWSRQFFTLWKGQMPTVGCPCLGLKELWLEIHTLQMEDTTTVTNKRWQRVFSQVGNMGRLEILTIKGRGLRKKEEAGIKFLEKLTCLKKLTLSSPNQPIWTRNELDAVVRMVPSLKSLDLRPLTDDNHAQVNTWLGQLNRT
ncbi:hypothetical protein BGX29_000123, partial [Mortierella sp. GBA35]